MIVEFVGPAGSGKSTVVSALKNTGTNICVRSPYTIKSFFGLILAPIKTVKVLYMLNSLSVSLWEKSSINFLIVCGAHFYYGKVHRNSTVVFDQLVFQALRRVSRENNSSMSAMVGNWLASIPASDLIVYSHAAGHVVNARLAVREGVLDDIEEKKYWRATLDNLRAIKKFVNHNNNNFLVLDTIEPVGENANRLYKFMQFDMKIDPCNKEAL